MAGRYKEGESGNPKGRPERGRAFAEMLRTRWAGKEETDEEKRTRLQILADMVWEGLLQGTVTFRDGRKVTLAGTEWFDLVRFLANHTDGPVKQELDVTSGGERITVQYVVPKADEPSDDAKD